MVSINNNEPIELHLISNDELIRWHKIIANLEDQIKTYENQMSFINKLVKDIVKNEKLLIKLTETE